MSTAQVFFSYAHDDTAEVERLTDALARERVSVWYDRELAAGDRWDQVLRDVVDACAALVLVMSPASQQSRWVRLEAGRARFQGRPIRPILLAGKEFPELAHLQYDVIQSGQTPLGARFVDRLRADLAAPVPPRRDTAGELVGRGLPPRNQNFVGRTSVLLDLEAGLYWGSSVAVEALQGTGGVGKTQLAAEYVYRRRSDYDLVVWINAERVELIPDQLAALADRLHVPTSADVPDTARAVLGAFAGTDAMWLLVFDNADQPGDLTEWLPGAGTGHVIVTSRQTGWGALGSRIDVDVLSAAEAIMLLQKRVPTIDDASADAIVEQLGRLPLAVEQAAAYLGETGTPPGEYLQLLRTRGDQLLGRGHARGYEHTVATVWEVSQVSLRMASPAAEQLLGLCAFLGPEPVPLNLFTSHPDLLPWPLSEQASDPVRFGAAVGALVTRSLGQRSDAGLTVHRLFATVVRSQLPDPDRPAATVLELLDRHLPQDIQHAPQNWPVWRALLPHVLAATDRAGAQPGLQHAVAPLLNGAGVYLTTVGQYDAARSLLERAVRIYAAERGPAHPITLAARGNLAAAQLSGGQLDRATDQLEGLLADSQRVHGPEHFLTLRVANGLAGAYESRGQLDSSITLYETILAESERTLGPDAPDSLVVRHNLASAHFSRGELTRAVPLFEATLLDRQRVLGPDHPSTLATQAYLAAAYESAGHLDRAIALFALTLAARERVLGPDDPTTLNTRNALGLAYHSAWQLDKAIPMLEASLADSLRVFTADHPMTVKIRNNLAASYKSAGEPRKAIPLYEANLADQRLFGPDHPQTLSTRNNLALAYSAAGRHDEAILLLESVLADAQRVLGPDHPQTLTARSNLATAYLGAGQTDRAIPVFEASLAEAHRVLGRDHPSTLESRNNLAQAYWVSGRRHMAIDMLESTLGEMTRVLGEDHPHTRSVREDLARAYEFPPAGKPAMNPLEAALADRIRVLGADHPETFTARLRLAVAHLELQQPELAVRALDLLIADYQRVLGADHPDTRRAREILAVACMEAGQVDRAILIFESVFVDNVRTLGPHHPTTLDSRDVLAVTHLRSGKLGRAIELFEASLADRQRVQGPDHPTVLSVRDRLAAARSRR